MTRLTRYLRPIAAASALALLTSCAAILYPERRGARSGRLDVVPLVVDILLFIPGLIPGLIAIIVDFGTGAIYTGTGSAEVQDVGRHGTIAIQPGELPEGKKLSMRLLDEDGTVLDADETGEGGHGLPDRLSVRLGKAARAHRGEADVPLTLEMQIDDKPPARFALNMK